LFNRRNLGAVPDERMTNIQTIHPRGRREWIDLLITCGTAKFNNDKISKEDVANINNAKPIYAVIEFALALDSTVNFSSGSALINS